ncbi:hypothetical protein V5O48_010847 [Marasmius crinis-equi]|uniref:Annexin n=1 Tax=Marasmius crinis-equi TaxID=585013 RepID=A0ABR3F793_9AGAR
MAGAPPPLPSNHPGPSSGPISYFMNVAVPTPMGPHQPPPPVPGYDPTGDYERIRKATKGFGTDETAIITTLVPLDPIKLANLSTAFRTKSGKDLAAVLDKETSGNFKETLHGLALGPLWYDVELAKKATRGLGTNEQLLNEIVTDRTFDDLRLLSAAYQQQYGRSLFSEVEGDLSWKTKRVFEMILTNNRPPDHAHVDYGQVERDVTTLYKAGEGKGGTDEIAFCDIIVNRSRPHLTAVCDAYSRKYRSLSKAIKREFSGHMREVLLYYVHGANHKHINEGHGVWRDAKLLEASMKGMGTKDADLLRRIVRLHWDKQRFQAVKAAYHKKYKKSLDHRVSGETSGDYKKLLLAIINS